jgi:ribonucleoside-triphosphate reductase
MTDKQQLLSDFKFYSSYSKFKKEDERMETWEEAIDRVMQMHYKKYQNKITPELQEYLDFATKQYKEKRILGSQRALQFGGDSILKHEMKQFNCLVSYCDRVEFFKEAMYLLLCGCGVGFSVQTLHVEKLPMIGKRIEGVKTFLIEDSIEGWADAIGVLLASYSLSDIKFQEYYGYRIDFDYSNIRPKGSYISGGFKAPGYEGLKNSLTKIQELLDKEINGNVQIPFKSIIAYDVVMHMADAVLSGGVRRSATICLFSATDNDMLNAKTGDWYIKNPQRGRSNNSVILIRNKTSKELFSKIMESVKSWGEPGFVWSSNEDIIYNPCVEIGMTPYYINENGNKISGWEGCNLTEINGSKCNTEQEFYDACKASAILGTLQAGYTNFKYVTDVTKKIFDREALLGCSITGFMNNPMILFNPEIQKKGAEIIKETNKIVSSLIGINQAARTTCVKPSGNASVILGTASGIHGEHSKKYFRNVQVNKEEELGKVIKILNPKMVENSLWSNNNSDWVISFPINSKEGSIYKKDLYGVKQLEYVKLTQQNWVEFGTNYELCVDKNTKHNVSNTIVVDNWDEVENYIYENKEWFAGISLLGMTGDKDYAQAPFTEVIDTDEIIKKYGKSSLFASGLIVDGLHAFRHLWLACNAVLFNSEIDENEADFLLKNDWIRRAKQFADRYFNSDIVKMTNCLKDISLYHKWLEINREYKDIDFNSMNIMPSYTDIDKLGAIACSGDQCTIQL